VKASYFSYSGVANWIRFMALNLEQVLDGLNYHRRVNRPINRNSVLSRGIHGGRSRTRTYDLSHVNPYYIAKLRQTFLKNHRQTISSAGESLASFLKSHRHHTDRVRHNGKSQNVLQQWIFATKNSLAHLKFQSSRPEYARIKCEWSVVTILIAYIFFWLSVYCPCKVSRL
jgi:hypothetical protein